MPRPNSKLTDTRRFLEADREIFVAKAKDDRFTPQEQLEILRHLAQIDVELAHLQLQAEKKWRKIGAVRREKRKKHSGNKGGRPRRTHDSHGMPLYAGLKPLSTEPSPEEKARAEFMESLK